MSMKFADGWSVKTDGPYRIIKGPDGLYVVGHGVLIPVETREEGEEIIAELNEIKK